MDGVEVGVGVVVRRVGGGEVVVGFVVRMFAEIDILFLSIPAQRTNAARLSILALDRVADHRRCDDAAILECEQ